MPVEKRNSRRVSFAPATNVLLFSKETRNGSPDRSLPQDLSDAITSENRNSVGIIGHGIQITDMENLLNTPLHSSQQRKEVLMVGHGEDDHHVEKTMMFSSNDSAMDVTYSHTVLIANDSDLPAQHDEVFSPCGNMDFFFSTDRGKAEPCILPKTPSSVHTFEPEFENLLASYSKTSRPRDNSLLLKVEQNTPMMPHDKENQASTSKSTKRENLPHKSTVKFEESINGGAVLSEDTQSMNMTDVFTGRIVENAPLQCLFPPMDLNRQSEHSEPAERNGRQQFFEAPKCSMSNPNDTRITTKISVADSKKCRVGVPSLQMGNSLNLHMSRTYPLPETQMILQNKNAHHVLGLKEYANRNTSNPDDMDMTRSQTVAIDSRSLHAVAKTKQQQEMSRFSFTHLDKTSTGFEDDLDFTRCQTGVIETKHLNMGKPSFTVNAGGSVRIMADNQRDRVVSQDKTTIDDMDITHCQTTAIESLHRVKPSEIKQKSQDIVAHGTKCINPSEDDDMEFTNCLTRVIEMKGLPVGHVGISGLNKTLGVQDDKVNRKPSQTVVSKYHDSESDDIEITRSHTIAIEAKTLNESTTALQNKKETSMAFFSAFTKACRDKTSQDENGMDMTHSNTLISSENVKIDAGTSRREGFEHYNFESDDMELTNQTVAIIERNLNAVNPLDFKSQKSFKITSDHKSTSSGLSVPDKHLGNGSLSCGLESASNVNAAVDRVDKTSSTGRMSLVDLQLKLRGMCHLLNEPTEKLAEDCCDAPLSQPVSASDGISDKTQLTASLHNPETQMTVDAGYTQPEQLAEEHQQCVTAPLNLKRKSLTSKLSLGNILPKLPQKNKPANPNKEHKSKIIPFNVTHQLSMGMTDDIGDEVLLNISSDVDLSESLVPEEPQSTTEDGSPLREHDVQGMPGVDLFELSPGHLGGAQSKKRHSPVDDEAMMATEKRRKPSLNSTIEMPNKSPEKEKCSIGTLVPAVMAQAAGVSNSSNTVHIGSETTFESTLKQSLFETQLEDLQDYDFQKNANDERITVSEFFKLFNLDFVIRNPRQSILPSKLASHLDQSPADLLKHRHINYPKQKVYELDHESLGEKVERLRARMKDQGRLLHNVNKPLWEELTCLTEDEMECFGAKLKESSNFFRRRSKAQSDEMKEALYSNLRQANLDEQQKLREKMEEADGMLRSLDDCIRELEAELEAVEGNGLDDDKPTLKSSQLELENVTTELSDKERQMHEMEMQKKCNMDQVKRLQTETQDLNDHITLLHRVNEWKVAERRANCDVYSFLYESLRLEVVFHTWAGKGLKEDNEKNVSAINFKFELDGEKSACHAGLVQTLLSEFTKGQINWLKKYPSKRCVPKLLHDVSLVVSRCRLLGEEVRLLKTWGSLAFHILDIACVNTSVHIVFSSLEAMAKFELSLAVTKDYPCCPLQMQNFKSHIGSTTAHRIEEVMSSVSPGKNYLTKIVKAIHAAVLS